MNFHQIRDTPKLIRAVVVTARREWELMDPKVIINNSDKGGHLFVSREFHKNAKNSDLQTLSALPFIKFKMRS